MRRGHVDFVASGNTLLAGARCQILLSHQLEALGPARWGAARKTTPRRTPREAPSGDVVATWSHGMARARPGNGAPPRKH